MVNEQVLIKDKHRVLKIFLKISIVLLILIAIVLAIFFLGFFKNEGNKIVLENPIKGILFANTNEAGQVDKQKVIEQGVLEFNEDYLNYIIAALGVNNLHKSYIGYGNPIIEMNIDNQAWNSEVVKGALLTKQGATDLEDLKIIMTKQEAVEALISPNIKEFMKTSVKNGNTQIEMIAGKVELGSKGYLAMYKELTGEEIAIDE